MVAKNIFKKRRKKIRANCCFNFGKLALTFHRTKTKLERLKTVFSSSVSQTGSNDEKNWRSKISFDCPFKRT